MALLFILDDEVVKLSPHARAIRDVEDEELRSFFYGMSPWQRKLLFIVFQLLQFILIVVLARWEELFWAAVRFVLLIFRHFVPLTSTPTKVNFCFDSLVSICTIVGC
ncbi:hypothetical protein IC575_017076 [Cucumis melo]